MSDIDILEEAKPYIAGFRFAFGTPKRAAITVGVFLGIGIVTSSRDLILLPIGCFLIFAGWVARKNGY